MTSPEPRSMNPANLSGAFQKRAAAPTLAKTRVDEPAPAPVEEPAQSPASSTAEAKAETAKTKSKPRTRRSTSSTSASTPRETAAPAPSLKASDVPDAPTSPKAAYVLLDLRERLNARARTDGRSQTNVVLDAIESTYEELQAAFDGNGRGGRTLFRRTAKLHRRDDGERGQITLRLTDEDSQVVEDLTREFGAKSRSELIEKALSLYLS